MFKKNIFSNFVNKAINLVRPRTKMDIVIDFFIKSKRLLIIIAATAVALLIILFCFNIYQKSAQEKYSAIFHQSLIDEERGDIASAQQNLQTIYNAKFVPSGVKGLASLRYASILLNSGSNDEALKIYKEIANSSRYDRYLRELSGLLAVKILVVATNNNDDKAAQQEALKQIEKFESRSKILHFYFTEQKGIFLMKIGELEKSYQAFETIVKDLESEQALKLRVSDMMKLLIAEGYVAKVQ